MPSSLTVNHSSASVFSTQLRVSVCGTGTVMVTFSGFSREPDYAHLASRKRLAYSQVRLKPRICLRLSAPTPFNRLFRQPAGLSLLRPRFTQYSSNGILTVSSIGFAVRLILRSRLTLIRLALIRKPQSFGEEVSRFLYRYLYLHLLFHALQPGSSPTFDAHGMLPYHHLRDPLLRQMPYARLLSMPDSSTSELLRTL